MENKEIRIDNSKESQNSIFKMLIEKLYSNPFESSLRELIANAIDANIENNCKSEDVIISWEDKEVKIKDRGKGLSPSDMEELYAVLFKSNKKDNNDLIGSYGIGRFSPLSYSNKYILNTVCSEDNQNTFYSYLIFSKDETIKYSLQDKHPTDNKTGTEVIIPIPSSVNEIDYRKFINKIQRFSSVPIRLFISQSEVNYKNNRFIVFEKERFAIKQNDDLSTFICTLNVGSINYEIPNNIKLKIKENINAKLFNEKTLSYCVDIHAKRLHDYEDNLVLFFDTKDLELTSSREKVKDNNNNYIAIQKALCKASNKIIKEYSYNFEDWDEVSEKTLELKQKSKPCFYSVLQAKTLSYKGLPLTLQSYKRRYLMKNKDTDDLKEIYIGNEWQLTDNTTLFSAVSIFYYTADKLGDHNSIPFVPRGHIKNIAEKSKLKQNVFNYKSDVNTESMGGNVFALNDLSHYNIVLFQADKEQPVKIKSLLSKYKFDLSNNYIVIKYEDKPLIEKIKKLYELNILKNVTDLGEINNKDNNNKKEAIDYKKESLLNANSLDKLVIYNFGNRSKSYYQRNGLSIYNTPISNGFNFYMGNEFIKSNTWSELLQYYSSDLTTIFEIDEIDSKVIIPRIYNDNQRKAQLYHGLDILEKESSRTFINLPDILSEILYLIRKEIAKEVFLTDIASIPQDITFYYFYLEFTTKICDFLYHSNPYLIKNKLLFDNIHHVTNSREAYTTKLFKYKEDIERVLNLSLTNQNNNIQDIEYKFVNWFLNKITDYTTIDEEYKEILHHLVRIDNHYMNIICSEVIPLVNYIKTIE